MRSELAVKRELARVNAERCRTLSSPHPNESELMAVQQALAWALEQNAASPFSCYAMSKPKPKAKASNKG